MPDDLDAASGLIQRVYALLLESRTTRLRLEAKQPIDSASEAERLLYLGMVSAFEHGLVRTMEEAVATMKRMSGAKAEEWLRRQLEGLGGSH